MALSTAPSLAIFVVLIEVAMCRYVIRDYRRNPLLDALEYRRDPSPLGFGKAAPFYFSDQNSEAASTNGQYRCIDKCEIRGNSYEECTVEFDVVTYKTKTEPCTVGGKVDTKSEHYFQVVKSSRGDKCKDECKPKGGFSNKGGLYAWCILDFDWQKPWTYEWSRCVPVGKETSMGLKCLGDREPANKGYKWREDCDYHCDCEDPKVKSCGNCGEFKTYKWCAIDGLKDGNWYDGENSDYC